MFLPTSRGTGDLAVVDVERGERVPSALGPPESSRNRPQGRVLSFVARDVPGLGYRRFELVEDGAGRVVPEPGALENEHYRVELDVDGGHAVSVLDRELGPTSSTPASPFGFAQVVRDLYGGALQATRRASGAPATYAEGRGSARWSRRARCRPTAFSSAARRQSRSAR